MPSAKWKKPPPDLVARFEASLPRDPEVARRQMFGCPCAFVNGNMACGLFEDSVMVRLGEAGAAATIAAGSATPFAPMGRTMKAYVVVPAPDAARAAALAKWVRRAIEYTSSLPPKAARARRSSKG
ncbi:MAG: TfoX/Sxy family protein [Burkholderiales bacterium]